MYGETETMNEAMSKEIKQLRKKISELHKEANIRKGVYDCYV